MKQNQETIVLLSEMAISDNPKDILTIPKLGACLGISVYDPIKKIGGVIHCLLPQKIKIHVPMKFFNPCLFVETGLNHLLKCLKEEGCKNENLIVQVAGGAKLINEDEIFNLGYRNFISFRKVMWENKLLIHQKDIGSNKVRKLSLNIENGQVTTNLKGALEI